MWEMVMRKELLLLLVFIVSFYNLSSCSVGKAEAVFARFPQTMELFFICMKMP
jgi:hypothetical protein